VKHKNRVTAAKILDFIAALMNVFNKQLASIQTQAQSLPPSKTAI